MRKQRRLSKRALEVLGSFVDQPEVELHGYEIMKLAGVSSGSLYPILQRFESLGWVEGSWEETDPSEQGRPRRRNYKVTGLGIGIYDAERSRSAEGLMHLVPGLQAPRLLLARRGWAR